MESHNIEKFIEIEDRLAQALTSAKIREKAATLIAEIRKAVASKPPDFQTAKLLSLELKQLNRLSNLRNQRFKNELQSLQSQADSIFLSFNNLANEISHIKKSINACLDFRSADLDLELVPVEEFFEKGAKEIGFDLNQKDDEHHLRIGRLNYELAQRNAMSDTLREQEVLKNLLSSDIKGKINRLGQIKPMIGNIKDAAKPLLDVLNLKKVAAETTPDSRKRAQLLPKELKLLHLYCGVYNELHPDETLIYGCEGETNAAEKFEKRQKSTTPPELDIKMEVEEEETIQQMRERILQFHPIALTLAIPCDELLANLHFYYLANLKFITVKANVAGKVPHSELFYSEHLLNDLLETDSGEECPNPVGTSLLKIVEMNLADHLTTIGKPYRFAQLISNNQGDNSNNSQFDNFKRLVSAIRQRVLDRLTLSNTLQQLSTSSYDRIFPEFVKKFEGKHSVRMSNVKLDFNLASQAEQQSSSEEQTGNTTNSCGFELRFDVSCSSLPLNVVVRIPYAYPRESPIFTLTPKQKLESEHLENALKEFETAINQKVLEKSDKDKFNLLATQVAVLIRRLSIVFNVEEQRKKEQTEDTKPVIVENFLFN
ncbi:hypothetical protein M3Y97_00149000 [Aphelenchoides bicaudatus]|nr:hypothetical protein M3Y97_00149000 [Aphelenchoides bicaudatus]